MARAHFFVLFGTLLICGVTVAHIPRIPKERNSTATWASVPRPNWMSITCEGAVFSIKNLCSGGIQIYGVTYGRKRLQPYCSGYENNEGLPWDSPSVGPECQVSVLHEFQKLCPEGVNSCNFPVTNDNLKIKDPCVDFVKYMIVEYICDNSSQEVSY